MRLSRSREADLILAISRDSAACVVFPAENYRRPDGFLVVHREGLQELLHRRLYRLRRDPDLGMRKLERTCATYGCVNPHHYALRAGLVFGTKRTCPNGHLYAVVGRTPSGHCSVCASDRAARRARPGPSGAELNAAKTECAHGHPYTVENTYRQRTKYGWRRKCRACNLASVHRSRGLDNTVTR